jgi:hypothetical protein
MPTRGFVDAETRPTPAMADAPTWAGGIGERGRPISATGISSPDSGH